MEPIRVQRSRAAGWRLPKNTVIVTRPGRYGNIFRVGWFYVNLSGNWFVFPPDERPFGGRVVEDLPHSLRLFETYARARARRDPEWLRPLRNQNLSCWCGLDGPCHADLLLILANRKES